MSYLGTKSGKDENKIENVHFHLTDIDGQPAFEEAKEVWILKKLYVSKFEKDSFIFPDIYEKNYPNDDLHYIYIGEITGVYRNE